MLLQFFSVRIFLLGLVLAVSTPVFAEESKPICSELKRLMNLSNKGISRYSLHASSMNGSEEQYFNLDVDGDDISDVVKGGCSSSVMPADPCFLLVEMSSGKKINFVFDITELFFLIRYKSAIYAIASPTLVIKNKKTGETERLPFERTIGRRSALRLDGQGIDRICTQL